MSGGDDPEVADTVPWGPAAQRFPDPLLNQVPSGGEVAADHNGFRIEGGVEIGETDPDTAGHLPQGRQSERVSFAGHAKNFRGSLPARSVSASALFGVEPFQRPLGSILFPAADVPAHAAAAVGIEGGVAELRGFARGAVEKSALNHDARAESLAHHDKYEVLERLAPGFTEPSFG